jgi:hypothetical protein
MPRQKVDPEWSYPGVRSSRMVRVQETRRSRPKPGEYVRIRKHTGISLDYNEKPGEYGEIPYGGRIGKVAAYTPNDRAMRPSHLTHNDNFYIVGFLPGQPRVGIDLMYYDLFASTEKEYEAQQRQDEKNAAERERKKAERDSRKLPKRDRGTGKPTGSTPWFHRLFPSFR